MKLHLLATLAGLAIGLPFPSFGQKTNAPDPQLRQAPQKDAANPELSEQLRAFSKKVNEAWNNGDAVALAALFTEDGVLVEDTGPIYGREAIKEHYKDVFQKMRFSNHIDLADQYSPHMIGTTGNEAWSNGEWTQTIQGQNWGPKEFKGNWLEVYRREGGTWKKCLDMWNVTPAPAVMPSPTGGPARK
jgi:ketosteroid isomerase-like protein